MFSVSLGAISTPKRNRRQRHAYAKFGGDKQRALSYVMVFSGVVNCSEVEQATSFECSREVIPVFFNS